jgi:hypothetical protein
MKVDNNLRSWATVRQLEYLDAIEQHGSHQKAAKVLGIGRRTLDKSIQALKGKAAQQGYAPEFNMTRPVPDGFKAARISTNYRDDGSIGQQWVIATEDQERQEAIRRAAFAAMSEDLPRVKPIRKPEQTIDALCNLVVFTDYHIGQLAWHKEGGADWDLKIAEKLLLDSFIHMVDAAPRAKSCVLCLQGDLLHTDGLLPLTPAHKNVLDTDGRFSKIVAVAIRVIRRLVDHALARHESVHLIICEGNHDEASSVWLRQMFAALYEQEPRITVNDSELPFYVHQHGETMLAFHHGHKVKNEQLPMLFAAQYPKLWGATAKRYCHTGHRHHVDEKEYAGMTVTQHPTLAARDAHASRGGWISERAAVVVTYHERFGQVARTVVCPEMFEEAA